MEGPYYNLDSMMATCLEGIGVDLKVQEQTILGLSCCATSK